jgi:hypothetical protein
VIGQERAAASPGMNCTSELGWCDRPAVVYVFGNGTNPLHRRLTFIGAERGGALSRMTPDGARCADHAVEELEAMLQVEAQHRVAS